MNQTTQQPVHFRDKVKAEATAQRDLKANGKPIPAELKRYARFSGVILIIGPGLGLILLYGVARSTSTIAVGAGLFFAFFVLVGVAQVITGRYFLAAQ